MTAAETKAEETQIRELIDRWSEDLRARDVSKLMRHYASELRVFDLPPPLEIRGVETAQKNWSAWLPSFEGPLQYETHELEIQAGPEVAYSHSLNYLAGKKKSGEVMDLWVRVTVGYRKIGGEWKIVHEHVSVPFYMDGSFRAAVDLKP